MPSRLALRLAAATLLVIPGLVARPAENPLADEARRHLDARVHQLGLDRNHGFATKNLFEEATGEAHVRMNQLYKGVRVFEGETIVHMRGGLVSGRTDALVRGLNLNVAPSLGAAEALAATHQALAPRGAYAHTPTSELVVASLSRPTLAYYVHTELENEVDGTRHTDFLVDAHTGAILESWNALHTSAANGTGRSQYSGTVTLNTNLNGATYELFDTTRGAGVKTYNLNHATSGTGTLYTDADNTWGDGLNYVEGSSTTADNGQTAGVDAHYGVQTTWDMYKNVFGRNGIDGAGSATYSRVHYSSSYDNAFWSDSCFCMTYGDGSSFTTLTSMDVAGHEMTHGVTSRTAALTYRGESGGLNESMSDIFGTLAEFYRGTTGATIPTTGGNWTIGEQLRTTPLRYMYKPSLDGRSPDAWSSTLKRLDVHYSSGPMNRCFYFLSQGTGTGNYASTYLPGGMTGIGNDKAGRIVYKALTAYMTSSTTYAGAKTACLNAAVSLGYPAGSVEYTAVVNAFKAINVN
ncbi:MAG: M4 family metallopeptidase [Geothrix sp.]|nr:M4 family metallopeptidase [Geothrix sp.]